MSENNIQGQPNNLNGLSPQYIKTNELVNPEVKTSDDLAIGSVFDENSKVQDTKASQDQSIFAENNKVQLSQAKDVIAELTAEMINLEDKGSVSGDSDNAAASSSSDVNATKGDDGSFQGIKGYSNMTKDEKKEALKGRLDGLKDEIKGLKEQLKSSPDNRELILKKEKLEEVKEKVDKEYDKFKGKPWWKTGLDILGLVAAPISGLGGILGIGSGILNAAKIVTNVKNATENVSRLGK